MSKEKYRLTIEPITCVHIGNGVELTPLEYFIGGNPKTHQDFFIKYSSDNILKRCATDKDAMAKFDKATSSGRMKDVLDFFVEKRDLSLDIEYKCHVTKEFVSNFMKNKDVDPLQNGRFVLQMYRPEGSQNPVIPGSSIKGSIRTALLNFELDNFYSKEELRRLRDNQIQKELLNSYKDAKEDPFRAIEISDCNFETKGTQLVGIINNIKKDHTGELVEHNTSTLQAEVIKGKLCSHNQSLSIGITHIRFNNDLSRSDLPIKGVSKRITKDAIIKACNTFYFKTFEYEYRKFYRDASDSNADAITQLYKELKHISSSDSNSFILRVGRWSQVEFVTYGHDISTPKTPNRKGKQMLSGTTRWVFNNDGQYLPLGWCKCTIEEL